MSFTCEVGWNFLQHHPALLYLRPILSSVTCLLPLGSQAQLSVPIRKYWSINTSLRYYLIRRVLPMGISALIKEPWTVKQLDISEKNSPVIDFSGTKADLWGGGGNPSEITSIPVSHHHLQPMKLNFFLFFFFWYPQLLLSIVFTLTTLNTHFLPPAFKSKATGI